MGGSMIGGMFAVVEHLPASGNQNEAALEEMAMTSGGLVLLGVVFLISVGIQIAGAVYLFKAKNTPFIYATAALTLLLVLGAVVWTKSFGVYGIVGLAAALLAFFGKRQLTV